MLKVRDLHAYYGKSRILHGVNMHTSEGEVVVLLGHNGVGHSTLAKPIMGMARHEGEILLRDENVSGLRTPEVTHRSIDCVPENQDTFLMLTVRQNLLLDEKRSPGRPKPCQQVEDMYQMSPHLEERENIAAGMLSGGEQQMLTLCRTLMGDPDFIIIDRPTKDLTPPVVTLTGEYLGMLEERDISILLMEQEPAIALGVSQRIYVMGYGRIMFEEAPQQLKADAEVRQEWLEV